LEGLRVVEVGDFISAAYCAKLLADLGADVIKVEPPHGDSARRYGPFRNDIPDAEASGLGVYLNTNKRGITLNLGAAADRATLDQLLDGTDILVENVEPAEVSAFRLEYPTLHAAHPSLIVTSISAFGRQGPFAGYRGHSLQAAAGSLIANRTGDPKRSPLSDPLNKPEFIGGVHGAAASLMSVLFRDRTSRAQHVDIAIQDVLTVATSGQVLGMALDGTAVIAERAGHRVPVFYPWTVLPVADGYMEFITMQDRHWRSFLEEMGDPEWGNDPRFQDMLERVEFADELDGLILKAIGDRTRANLWQAFRERKISFQPVHRIDEVIESDHMKAREFFQEVLDGDSNPITVPGPPYRLSATPWAIDRKAPSLGEHTDSVLAGIADTANEVRTSSQTAAKAGTDSVRLPLEGVRVLDFGQVWAGPLLALFLADFGAEVIRITSPAREAVQPGVGAQVFDPADVRAYDGLYRNRVNLSLDPTTEAGREILDRLVAVSDVVLDNFSPVGRSKLGLDYSRLRQVNPRIIVAALSAAGQSGPWSDVLTYGPALTALYGIKSLLGYAGESELQEDVADLDPLAATYATVAILASLRAREQTGEGQFIDMAQGESGIATLVEPVLEYTMNGRVMGPTGNQHRVMAPHGIYPSAGDDSWVSIAADSEAAWQSLCTVLHCTELREDSRFLDMSVRLQHRDELDSLLSACTESRDAVELTAELQQAGVPSYPVVKTLGALADPQLCFRRELVRIAVDGIPASGLFTGTPWRMSESPPTIHTPAKEVGADNDLVFRDILGMTDEEVERAAAAGALG
jgi:crotonobetainyl-CoA:carnitine CoA-transferase CaiB-like acyl-CoA transferase